MSEYIVKVGVLLRAYDGFIVEADSDADAIERAKAARGPRWSLPLIRSTSSSASGGKGSSPSSTASQRMAAAW